MKINTNSRIVYAIAVGFLASFSGSIALDASAQQSNQPIDLNNKPSLTSSEQFLKGEARLDSLESEVQLPDDASAQEAGIQVSMKLNKQAYTIGEPVNLRIEINNGNQYLLTEEPPCDDVFLVNIFIRDAEGKRLQLNESASRKRNEFKMLRKWRAGVDPEPKNVTFKRAEAQKEISPGTIVLTADDIRTGGGAKCIGSSIGLGGKMIREFNLGNYYTISSPGNYSITYSARMILRDPGNSNLVKNVYISETAALFVK